MIIRTLMTLTLMVALAPGCAEPKPVESTPAHRGDAEESAQDDTISACVKTCTDARRAEAMAWEAIVRACEASCQGK